jgi:hypothetical protein
MIGGGARVHGGEHSHGWLCNWAKNKPDDCRDGQQTAYAEIGDKHLKRQRNDGDAFSSPVLVKLGR